MDTGTDKVGSKKRKYVLYGPVAALVVTIGAYFGSQIIAGFLFSLLPIFSIVNADTLNRWFDTVLGQFIAVTIVEAAIVGLILWFMRSRKVKLTDVGLVRPKVVRDIAYAFAGYLVYFMVFIVFTTLVKILLPGLNLDQEQEIIFSKETTGASLVLVFMSLVVLPPLTEEFVMRGFLFSGLRRKLSFVWTTLIVSVLFAAAHLQWGSGNALLWVAAIDTFALSIILVYLREKSGSLWPPIFVHMLKNGLAFTLLFILKVS